MANCLFFSFLTLVLEQAQTFSECASRVVTATGLESNTSRTFTISRWWMCNQKSRTFTISRWWLQVGYLFDLRGEQSELPGGASEAQGKVRGEAVEDQG